MTDAPPAHDGDPFEILNRDGRGRVVLVCEHASSFIPERYDGLGLTDTARVSHAAWDPGARALSLALSDHLDAPLVAGTVSRLVYDCNRPPEAKGAMVARSEAFLIPGNTDLTEAQKAERVATVYTPFRRAVAEVIEGRPTPVLVTIHSFTPVYFGARRETEIGILHDTDRRLADEMLARNGLLADRRIDRNRPYGPEDGVTHTLQVDGLARGIPNVMIEVRNDLLRTPSEVAQIAGELLQLLEPALGDLHAAPRDQAHA